MPELIAALRTEELLALVPSLRPSTLQYWIDKGLVGPSVRGSVGHRYSRLWTLQDAVAVRAINALREAGCPLQRIREALRYLNEHWEESINENYLYWNGLDLVRVASDGEAESAWSNPGQLMFRSMAQLPIGAWRTECATKLVQFDRDELERDQGRGALPVWEGESERLSERRRRRSRGA